MMHNSQNIEIGDSVIASKNTIWGKVPMTVLKFVCEGAFILCEHPEMGESGFSLNEVVRIPKVGEYVYDTKNSVWGATKAPKRDYRAELAKCKVELEEVQVKLAESEKRIADITAFNKMNCENVIVLRKTIFDVQDELTEVLVTTK